MRVRLEEVCKRIYAGGDVPKERYSEVMTEEYYVPIYANAEKDNGLYGYTDKAREEELSITVAARGTIGFTAIRREPFFPVVRLITVVPDTEKVSERYLYYVLKNCKPQSSGTSIPQLTVPDIKKNSLELYPISKQESIANQLDKVNRVIELRKQELNSLDCIIKARFVEMFGSIFDNKYGYDVMTLQEVCELIKDGTHQTPTYTEDSVNGVKFLSSKDVVSGEVDWHHLKYIPKELHNELYKRISPKKGDILLAKNGTTGIAAIVDRDEVFDIYVSLALLRPLDMVTSEYLCSALNSIETKHQFDGSLKGIGVPNLHLGEIKKTRIIVPPIKTQEQFADFVHQVDKSKVAVQKALDETQMLFDSLMQEYFG